MGSINTKSITPRKAQNTLGPATSKGAIRSFGIRPKPFSKRGQKVNSKGFEMLSLDDLIGDVAEKSVLSPYLGGKNKGYEIGQITALHRIGWKSKEIAAECLSSEQAVKRVTDDLEFSADTYATRGVDQGRNEVREKEDNILLVRRADVPGMAHVVYGGDSNAPFVEPESNNGTGEPSVPAGAVYPGCSKDNSMTLTKSSTLSKKIPYVEVRGLLVRCVATWQPVTSQT